MSWENVRINIKDVLQIVSFVVVAAFFFSAQSSKIEAIAEAVKEIKSDNKESSGKTEAINQSILNQINTNSIQIKILEQKVIQLENRRDNK